jgi:hypothetical protein
MIEKLNHREAGKACKLESAMGGLRVAGGDAVSRRL